MHVSEGAQRERMQCVCLKTDNTVSVSSTKFTSVLTELSGLPFHIGGDRQCISSLRY